MLTFGVRGTVLMGVALVGALASGCSVQGITSSQISRPLPVTVPAGSVSRLVLDSHAGSVTVSPGDGVGATVTATAYGPDEASINAIKVTATRTEDGTLTLGWDHSADRNRTSVSFVVTLPATATLDLHTGAGSIEVGSFRSGAKARTGAGSVKVFRTTGDLAIQTGAGSIKVVDLDGSIDLESGAGSVHASGRPAGKSRIQTGAGSIEVDLPEDVSLTVEGRTDAGSATSDFASIRANGKFAAKTLSGVLGDGGGGTLDLDTDAGSIRILSK
jgi:hypothetical protein